MTTLNLADLVAVAGYVSLKEAHDDLAVTGGDSWWIFYSDAVGENGHLADLMYAYWLNPSGPDDPDGQLLTEDGDGLATEAGVLIVIEPPN